MHLSNEAALDPCWRQTYQKTVAWGTAVTALSAATRGMCAAIQGYTLNLHACLHPYAAFRP
jgi:hypothetical protein